MYTDRAVSVYGPHIQHKLIYPVGSLHNLFCFNKSTVCTLMHIHIMF